MALWSSPDGKPLADARWLEDHHAAKIPERTAFARRLARLAPSTVVDLGCATGLWLGLLDEIMPVECRFVGVDSDESLLEIARERSGGWDRESRFVNLDLNADPSKIPGADLTLAFNVFPYINDPDGLVRAVRSRSPGGALAVRQYDGAAIRFGPMGTSERQEMEASLRVSAESSRMFRHYDLDLVGVLS